MDQTRRGFFGILAGLPLVGGLFTGNPGPDPNKTPIHGVPGGKRGLFQRMHDIKAAWKDVGGQRVFVVHPHVYYLLLDYQPHPWEPRGFSFVRFEGVPVFGSKKVKENDIWYVVESDVNEWMSD